MWVNCSCSASAIKLCSAAGEAGPSVDTTYRLPFLRIFCNAIRLIDGLVAAADVNVAVIVRVVANEQLIVLQLQLF